MGDGLHLARETHACAARPATGVPVTMFSSWRLFSEELPIADIPGIMMRLGARHRTSKNADIAMATFLKIFIVVLLVVLLAHAFIGCCGQMARRGFRFYRAISSTRVLAEMSASISLL